MFPERLRFKLDTCPGTKGDRLKNILLKIGNLREKAQGLQLLVEAFSSCIAVGRGGDDRPGPGTRQRSQGSEGRGHKVVRGPVAHKHPRRDMKRRNCNMLENEKSKSKPFIEDTGTALKVENQNKTDRKLDDDSQNVEKVDDYDIPEFSEKEIDDNLQEKVSQ